MNRVSVVFFVLLPVFCTPARAYADLLVQAAACPQLFGDNQAHAENEDRRERYLDSILEATHTINLVHSSGWSQPDRIRFKGLKLVETQHSEEAGRVAAVRVKESVGSIDCDPGLYWLGVDDSLGKHHSVLAILDGVVLLTNGEDLLFLLAAQYDAPVFRMIWRSTWKMPILPGHSGRAASTKRPHSRRSKKAKRSVPTQRRRRR